VKLTVNRAIPVVLVLDVAALLLSGVGRFKDAKHGVDLVLGDIFWLGFLVGALAVIVLATVALVRTLARRRAGAASA